MLGVEGLHKKVAVDENGRKEVEYIYFYSSVRDIRMKER